MRKFKKEVAAAVILSEDDRVLMGMKKPNSTGVYIGYWVLPGGVVDEEKTYLETFHEEVRDETGLDLSAYEPELVDDTGEDEAELTLSTGERILYQMKFNTYRVIM